MQLSEIQQALRDAGLDGWLFVDHHQRDPLAYRILGLPLDMMTTRRWYYYIPAEGEPRGIVHRIEPHSLDAVPGKKAAYSRWQEQHEQLRKMLGASKRIAMQYSPQCAVMHVATVDAGTVELVRSCGVDVFSAADLVQAFEARWSDAQLESHLEAGRRMDRARHDAFVYIADQLRAGAPVSEYSVQQFLRDRYTATHMVTDHGPIVAVNANASDPHYEPSAERNKQIREGDLVLIDMWAKLDSPEAVYYDITWTGYCGPSAPDAVQNVFRVVRDARDAAVDFVKSSVSAQKDISGFQVDDAARQYIESRNLGEWFVHRTGHSIGTSVHGAGANMDNFETHDERRIVPRTCFSVEPGVYLPEFGIRSEVNVYVGENDARVTGEAQTELVPIL